jgi:uncharacterized protein YkwD
VWDVAGRCGAPAGPKPARAVEALEDLAACLAMPISGTGRRILERNARLAESLKDEEAEGIRDLNRIRLTLGLRALHLDPLLCKAARGHSTDMRKRKFFSHDSPVPGKATPWDRARQAGTRASAENIAGGTSSGRKANQMWFHSPGHFKNMLGAHKRVGLGHDGGKWTALFGR